MKYVIYSESLEKYVPIKPVLEVRGFRLFESYDSKLWFIVDSKEKILCESEFKTYAQECLERVVNEA